VEAIHSLSNFVVEPGVAELLARYRALLDRVIQDANDEEMPPSIRANAVWVLANMVAKVTEDDTKCELLAIDDLWLVLEDASVDNRMRPFKADVAAREADVRGTAWMVQFCEDSESEDSESTCSSESEDSDVDMLACVVEDVPAATGVAAAGPPAISAVVPEVIPAVMPEVVPAAAAATKVPTALDLMMADRAISPVVRGLVALIQEAGVSAWVPVPADTVLTIEDLTTFQLMGYCILRGFMGVNPSILGSI
jgi:hypothetical protein